MKSLNRNEINPVKMATNPPEVVVNSGMRIINSDGYIYEYIGISWIKTNKANRIDFQNIPELIG